MESLDNLLMFLVVILAIVNFIVFCSEKIDLSPTTAIRHLGILLIMLFCWLRIYNWLPDERIELFGISYHDIFWYSGAFFLLCYNLAVLLAPHVVQKQNSGEQIDIPEPIQPETN
jgi:hypothetical protein